MQKFQNLLGAAAPLAQRSLAFPALNGGPGIELHLSHSPDGSQKVRNQKRVKARLKSRRNRGLKKKAHLESRPGSPRDDEKGGMKSKMQYSGRLDPGVTFAV